MSSEIFPHVWLPEPKLAFHYGFMKELKLVAKVSERVDYLPEWPGFHRVFGLHIRGAGEGCHIELDKELEAEFSASSTPHIVLADRLIRTIQGWKLNVTSCPASYLRTLLLTFSYCSPLWIVVT